MTPTRERAAATDVSGEFDPAAVAWFRRFAQVSGWGAIAVAAIVLALGWAVGIQQVASLLADAVAMKPNTAACIGLIGLALVSFERGWPRALAVACGAVVTAVATFTLIEFAVDYEPTWFDELIFEEVPDPVGTAIPGRMAINTAVSFLLLGVVVVLLALGRLPRLRQWLAVAAASVSFVALLGYLLGVPAAGELFLGDATRMALPTAICLLVLSYAAVAAQPDVGWARMAASRFAGGQIVRRLAPAMVGTLLLVVVGAHYLLVNAGASVAVAAQVALGVMILVILVFWALIARLASRIDAEREATNADLARANNRLRLMFESATIGMVTAELDARLVTVNPAFAQMLGRTVDELVGTYLVDITHPDDVPALHQAHDALRTGEITRTTYEKRYLRPDGGVVWARIHAGLLMQDGVPVGYQSQYEDVTAVHESESRLGFLTSHDALTGLPNRDALVSLMARAPEDRSRPVGVVMLNIDHFKVIDEAASRAAGDHVLTQIADRLRAATQGSDVVGRLGGDEFLVVLDQAQDAGDLERAARQIREALSGMPFDADGTPVWLTASMGLALTDGTSVEELLASADAALTEAKAAGGDSWRVFSPEMRHEAAQKLEVAWRLRAALDSDAVHAWFQPVVTMADRTVVGYEALARWIEPGETPIIASDFVRSAMENGLMARLGHKMTSEAIAHLAELPTGVTVALNASPLELANPDFLDHLRATLDTSGATPDRLILEVTEDSLLNLNPTATDRLVELVGAGVGLHVDDFGTGFSSLVTLRDFPVTGVKLDASFTRHLGADPDHPAVKIARGLAQMAQSLDLARIAEGVETTEQEQAAVELGWDLGQGWLYGPAEPPRVSTPGPGSIDESSPWG